MQRAQDSCVFSVGISTFDLHQVAKYYENKYKIKIYICGGYVDERKELMEKKIIAAKDFSKVEENINCGLMPQEALAEINAIQENHPHDTAAYLFSHSSLNEYTHFDCAIFHHMIKH